MRNLTALVVCLCLLVGAAEARKPRKEKIYPVDIQYMQDRSNARGMFGLAQPGTTWFGWKAGTYDPVTNPHSVGIGGVWDFDDGGTRPCPTEDGYQEYIKNGAYAQGWTSEDVYAQKYFYWHAEDFSDPAFSCQSNSALSGTYSAWCGTFPPDIYNCYEDPPGYGTGWNQWLCMTVENPTALQYTFKSDVEPDWDYVYVIIDAGYPDSCGWAGDAADTLRCYTGVNGLATETFDLTNLPGADPDFCAEEDNTTSDYSSGAARICFVVISDNYWDDQDGKYTTCDGAFTVDDIIVTTTGGVDTTTFETGTLEGWQKCGGWSAGDYAAIRHIDSIYNSYSCGFELCDMAGCVLTFYDPDIPGEFGFGGHFPGRTLKRVWSPTIDLTSYPDRGYVLDAHWYADVDPTWAVYPREYTRYVQNPDCPTGAWSAPESSSYIIYIPTHRCSRATWTLARVPADAESLQIGLAVFGLCDGPDVPACEGNQSPAYDRVRLGLYDVTIPELWMVRFENYTDAFPEVDVLGGNPSSGTALIDVPSILSGGNFLRLGDTLTVRLPHLGMEAEVEFCFRVVPGPGTDTGDPWFAGYGEGGLAACDTSAMHCVRMDTSFIAGDGIPGSEYEFQVVEEPNRFSSMIHEEDPRYVAEGEEIFPDSLFTPGTKLFYAIRASFLDNPGDYQWLPFGADPAGGDLSTWYEVSVLPDQCRGPLACLLYVDYGVYAQQQIERALTQLGRTWDRFDRRDYGNTEGAGIGNRFLGPGKYRLARGPIGPSLDHLAQYKVLMLSSGYYGRGRYISDGAQCGYSSDPSNDIGLLDQWINEGTYRGLWISGKDIASEFANCSPPSPAIGFLNHELATSVVSNSYRDLVGHPNDENCRVLFSNGGDVINNYSSLDSLRLWGTQCGYSYGDYDVLEVRPGASGRASVSLMYDRTDITHPPGYYASLDHIFTAANPPYDTVRTKIDGFNMDALRNLSPPCNNENNYVLPLWIRDVLGGVDNKGYFYDNDLDIQYCPPVGPETIIGLPEGPGRAYANALFQNYPNPFRRASGTTIHYTIAKKTRAEVRIFDVVGRLVNTIIDEAEPGDNFVVWDGRTGDGRRLSSGVYFYQLKTGAFVGHKKMLLVN